MKGSFEFARLICVLLLIFTHTRHNYSEGLTYFILEEVPKIGTLILSLISGYLYYSVSRKNKNIFEKKVKSLLIPYLIANISVLSLVVIANFIFEINFLNRLDFNFDLFFEGIIALNSPPINPPTFFIRDIFIIFVLIEIFRNKKYFLLVLILPLAIYGELILRYEILYLFVIGLITAKYSEKLGKSAIILIIAIFWLPLFYFNIAEIKHLLSILFFIGILSVNLNFKNVGGFTYLLHLYHSPIIVFVYPIISYYFSNQLVLIISQIILSIIFIYAFYFLTRKITFLKLISGQR
tara:strand:- start:2648 stop:3529 length:882 start_codon:yes stop_codon:yes gene_type:complete